MSTIIETITAGGKLKETVEIMYKDNNGRVVTTETEPYEIRNGTYICWCYLRNRRVEILLKNIIDAVLIGKAYMPRFHVDFDDSF
ncbi:MAG: hypothetical protein ACYC21_15600 [Eubacteriales bacterium]